MPLRSAAAINQGVSVSVLWKKGSQENIYGLVSIQIKPMAVPGEIPDLFTIFSWILLTHGQKRYFQDLTEEQV
jgi:hypothetical protein